MNETEVAAFLAGARTLNVATLASDGTIHLVAMWFVMHGASPVFWTYARSQKARNLSRDPRDRTASDARAERAAGPPRSPALSRR